MKLSKTKKLGAAALEKQEFLKSLEITEEERDNIKNELQRSEKWHIVRENRLTASSFGAAAGHSPYCSPYELINQKLWDTFKGNEATEYGTKLESTACQMAQIYFQKQYGALGYSSVWIEEVGLYINRDYYWLGASADGILHLEGGEAHGLPNQSILVEIKCPYAKAFYPTIPHQYYDQIQGCMALLGLKSCKFIVLIPDQLQISTYAYDENYWKNILFPALESWYMTKFLKRKLMKNKGLLKPGCIDIVPMITIE